MKLFLTSLTMINIFFFPDHLTHLDLAAGIHHHNHNHNHSHHKQQCPGMISNLIFDSSSGGNKPSKTCMSSSLSTSFLNQSSCAVPTSSHFNDNKMAFSLQPSFSSNEIWNEMTKNGKNTSAMSFCSIHQKQCPQFYKDCWKSQKRVKVLFDVGTNWIYCPPFALDETRLVRGHP